jgi:AsmA-like C-terminal region
MPMRRKLLLGIIVVLAVIAAGVYLFANRMLGSDLVRTTLEQQLSACFGQPVHIRSVAASLFPRVAVNLRDVTVGESAAVQLGDLRVVTGLRGLFSRTIEDAEIVVSRSRLSLPLPFSLVPAPAPNAPATSGPGFTVTSIRVISFRDIDAVAGNQAVRFNLDASVDGDRLDITRLTMNGKRTRVEAHGALTSIASLQGTVEAKAEPLDLDETIAIASAFTAPAGLTPARGSARPRGQVSRPAQPLPQDPKTRSSETIPMHIIAKIAAPSGQFGAYAFRDFSSSIDLAPGRVSLSPVSVRTFDGKFQGRVDVDTSGTVPRMRLNGRVEGLNVADAMKASGSPGGITGRLAGAVNLRADSADAAGVMRSAHGTIDAAVTDGSIPHLDMVRTIVLAFGKPTGAPPQGSGSAFSRLAGTFALANETLTSDNLSFASRDFDMQGRGMLNLASTGVDARAEVALSQELTAQAGTDLRRYAQQDGRVIVPANVGGTLSSPHVSVDVAAAMKRALGNDLKRRTNTLLEGLFKKKGGG